VILNVIANGIDAMSEVTDRPRELSIRSRASNEEGVIVGIRDCGSGFGPRSVERLFDAFFTTKQAGMGLGLSISRTIVEGHGGRLWAMANSGPGATFQFTLPMVRGAAG
jgi:signal transduction histidine kinase